MSWSIVGPILAVVSVLLAIVGIIQASLLSRRGKPRLTWRCEVTKMLPEPAPSHVLSISYGSREVHDVHVVTLEMTNTGHKEIRPEDVKLPKGSSGPRIYEVQFPCELLLSMSVTCNGEHVGGGSSGGGTVWGIAAPYLPAGATLRWVGLTEGPLSDLPKLGTLMGVRVRQDRPGRWARRGLLRAMLTVLSSSPPLPWTR